MIKKKLNSLGETAMSKDQILADAAHKKNVEQSARIECLTSNIPLLLPPGRGFQNFLKFDAKIGLFSKDILERHPHFKFEWLKLLVHLQKNAKNKNVIWSFWSYGYEAFFL